jgi:hypothetical protein
MVNFFKKQPILSPCQKSKIFDSPLREGAEVAVLYLHC